MDTPPPPPPPPSSSSAAAAAAAAGCCNINVLKYVLFIFNFIFLVGGIAVLAVSSWTLSNKHTYIALLTTTTYATTVYLLLVAGIISIPAALLACCAIHKENKCYLLVYTFLLVVVFLVEAVSGVLAYVYEEQIMSQLNHTLQHTFREHYMHHHHHHQQQQQQQQQHDDHYGDNTIITLAIDTIQEEFQCCGADSYSDWASSEWILSGNANNNTVPDSCCKTPSLYCGVRDHPSNIWYNGCIHSLEEELSEHLLVLGATGCGLCIIQLVGVVLACCLYLKLRRMQDYYYGKKNHNSCVPYKQQHYHHEY